MDVQRLRTALAMIVICASVGPALAQTANPELEACRTTGLMALRERNPAIKDITLDVDGMTHCEGEHEGRGHPDQDNCHR